MRRLGYLKYGFKGDSDVIVRYMKYKRKTMLIKVLTEQEFTRLRDELPKHIIVKANAHDYFVKEKQ